MEIPLYSEIVTVEKNFAGGSITAVLTAPASANTKGTYTLLTAQGGLAYDCDVLMLQNWHADTGGIYRFLHDIAIGPLGSEQVIIPNLLIHGFNTSGSWSVVFPLPLRKGTRISSRIQASTGSQVFAASLHTVKLSDVPVFSPIFQCANYGASTSTTNGTSVDPGGVANQYGAWVEIAPALDFDTTYLTVMIADSDTSGGGTGQFAFQLGEGALGAEVVIVDGIRVYSASTGANMQPLVYQFQVEIKKGHRISARAASDITGSPARIFTMAIIAAG